MHRNNRLEAEDPVGDRATEADLLGVAGVEGATTSRTRIAMGNAAVDSAGSTKASWFDIGNNGSTAERDGSEMSKLRDEGHLLVGAHTTLLHPRRVLRAADTLEDDAGRLWGFGSEPSSRYRIDHHGVQSSTPAAPLGRTLLERRLHGLLAKHVRLVGSEDFSPDELIDTANRLAASRTHRVMRNRTLERLESRSESDTINAVEENLDRQIQLAERLQDRDLGTIRDRKTTIGIYREVRDSELLASVSIESGRHPVDGTIEASEAYLRSVAVANLRIAAAKDSGHTEGGMSTTDKLHQDMRTILADVKISDISSGKIRARDKVVALLGLAKKFGIDKGGVIDVIAENMSRDYGDFGEVCSYLISESTDQEKSTVLYKLSSSFLDNSVDERVGSSADSFGFSDDFEYRHYRPIAVSRSYQAGMFLIKQIDKVMADISDEVALERFEAMRQAITREMVQHINVVLGKPDLLDISAEGLDAIVANCGLSQDLSKLTDLSIAARAYERITQGADDVEPGLLEAISMQKTFTIYMDDSERIHVGLGDQIKALARDIHEMKNPSQKYVARLLYADIFATSLDRVSSTGQPEVVTRSLWDLVDPALQSDVEAVIRYRDEVAIRQQEYIDEVRSRDGEALVDVQEWAKIQYPDRLSDSDIDAETQRIAGGLGLSINADLGVIENVLFRPPHRFMSSWETSSRDATGYAIHRDNGERRMGIRREGYLGVNPQPIYGAVTSNNGRDGILGGAGGGFGGGFGSAFVELDTEKLAERTVVVPRDSGRYWDTRNMGVTFGHSARLVAINNLANGRYCEAQILGGVTADDIRSVVIDVSEQDRAAALIERIQREYPEVQVRIVDRRSVPSRKKSVVIGD